MIPKASVIIPARNAARTLPACLDALQAQDYPAYEIIVVDDHSEDATARLAQVAGVLVCRSEKFGPAAARNVGVRMSSGEILCFTDADCAPQPDWLSHLVAAFDDPTVQGTKGIYRTHQRGLVARFVQLEYEMRYQRMARFPQIDFIDTYSAAYRREIFDAVGGFDEGYTDACVEDQDLSFRVAATGAKLIFTPAAIVYHQHVSSIRHYARRKYRIGYWKMRLLRHMPDRASHDSHTPQTLKFQIVLAAVLGIVSVLPLLWPARIVFGSLVLLHALFWGSGRHFAGYVWQHDRTVLLLFPILLLVRAYALGCGMVVGLWEFWFQQRQ